MVKEKKVIFKHPICGKTFKISRFERDRAKYMGILDFCLHNCDIDPNDCKYWLDFNKRDGG